MLKCHNVEYGNVGAPCTSRYVLFCKQHPKIKIYYQFPNFCFDHSHHNPPLQLLFVGTALTIAMRGDDAGEAAAVNLLPRTTVGRVLFTGAQVWRDTWAIDRLLRGVENFCFWPKEERWKDGLLIDIMRDEAQELGASRDQHKAWVEHMLEWKENGITAKK
ncbi:hypothetical protein IQ06DRAFT_347382 [Phaeosphaeriaceae sp. SRC1lsM3a]|nr:hypothetical protein IQ06DRAFT_347382 [Stagonospora sp. SRC1lsM3a]